MRSFRKSVCIAALLFLCDFASGRVGSAAESSELVAKLDATGPHAKLVADPAATAKKAVAVDVSSLNGVARLKSSLEKLEAGTYRVILFARLLAAPDDDLSKLVFEFSLGDGKNARVKKKLAWTQFDSSPQRYSPIEFQLELPSSIAPTFDLGWQQTATGPGDRVRPIRRVEPPSGPKATNLAGPKKSSSPLGDDLLAELTSENKLTPLSAIDYPALLVDRVIFQPLSRSQWVSSVRPRYVHTYPNQANPIRVALSNTERRSVVANVSLEIFAGLDERLHSETKSVTLAAATAAASVTPCEFEWLGAPREFGHEARVTINVDGKMVHTASDYFSVSLPIWKTAIQASGFLDWYGREKAFPEHVASNRARYFNVEEAFSWQPSSWTNLTPDGQHWWSGQGDAHNSLEGLKQWIGLSHEEGIKMITYLWPSASGREGLEWARERPELVTHVGVGFAAEFFDVEDLRLKPIVEANPRLWRLRSGIWNNVGVNRGMLRTIEKGMAETIESSKRFGWDGARFDSPPSWSAMSAADMHSEFAKLKVEPLMKQLVPEYFEQRDGQWSGEAVSVTNARYARHRLREHDPRFALSFNNGGDASETVEKENAKVFDTLCADGGQIMDEAIRLMNRATWKEYFARVWRQGEVTRRRDGYHCVVYPNATSAATRLYAGIATFVGGSHPYGDFGWALPMPGHYTQFMTRYGEFCWGRDLSPVTAEASGFSIANDSSLWWRDWTRSRSLSTGGLQFVLQLVSAPPAETMSPEKPGTMQPWRRDIVVSRQSAEEPSVWALTAEPSTLAMPIKPRKVGNRFEITIPEHRVWTVLVWTESSR